jgi:hypothetical protein
MDRITASAQLQCHTRVDVFFFCQCPGKARKVLLSQGHSNPDEPPSDLSTSSPRLAPSNASLQTGQHIKGHRLDFLCA